MRIYSLFFFITLLYSAFVNAHNIPSSHPTQHNAISVGAEQMALYLPMLTNKRVGLVVNQTSMIKNTHLVDALLAEKINIKAIFAPEHGFRGDHDAGQKFDSSVDERTGIPLVSIYGKQRKPSAKIMSELDVIVFDIQDVGVRFYTYISSMHYMMEASADADITFIVLDRPNPNGSFVDGPILDPKFTSFVGMHQIPLLHGMTIAELALMFKGERWLKTDKELTLKVIKVDNYQRNFSYSLPVKPSPNLPNDTAIALYPSLAFFEATPVSIGRGTPFPFQVIGHNEIFVDDFTFTPVSTPGAAIKPKLMDVKLYGEDLRKNDVKGLDLSFLIHWYHIFKVNKQPFFTRASFMDKLSGTDQLRKAILAGKTEIEIKETWQQGINQFKEKRQGYLLYKDF